MNHELRTTNLKVAVLAGGVGAEREVSLQSGENIYNALLEGGVDAVQSDITPDDLGILDDASIDVFFLALHGQFGEDGRLQEILEDRNLCFTGAGSEASRKSFDKLLSKQAFFHAHLPIARHLIVQSDDTPAYLEKQLKKLATKFVIKPLKQGSSVGIEIFNDASAAAAGALACFQRYGDCMVEEFVAGREVTVGILNGAALPPIEIRSKTGFYDYHAKYVDDATEYLFDTITDDGLVADIQQMALTCFHELGCRHLSRVDFILTEDSIPYILEINTLPGFTSHSLLPMAARKAGIPTPLLCMEIVEAAWNEYQSEI
ncbi:MAG: D-alanine--D-alanine ligase [Phycisphaerae bacterium]|nr:D-alanine--D-alanine ligase [Phycisphaerae bacterium]